MCVCVVLFSLRNLHMTRLMKIESRCTLQICINGIQNHISLKNRITRHYTRHVGGVIRVKRVIMVIIVIRVLRVNYYQSAFNSQKEKLNILAEMLKI